MSLRLGEVFFDLGANHRDLQRSVQVMHNFGRAVDQVQSTVQQAANNNATAYRRQEKALTDALNRTLALGQAMRKVEGGERFARQAASAFAQLNTYLTSGQRSTLEYQRAMEQFKASTNNATRAFKEFADVQKRAASSRLTETFKGLQSSAILIQGPLGGIATRVSTLSSLFTSVSGPTAAFFGGIAIGTVTLGKFSMAILEAGKAINSFQSQLTAVTGDIGLSNDLLARVIRISRNTGQAIEDLATPFARFTVAADGTGMTMKQVEEGFRITAAAATKLQLSQEQSVGIFRALEQMMSKGTIQAEELRGQLGDRLPGAVQIMARALGVSTRELQEMMKAGEVLTATALPKFFEELARTLNIGEAPITNYTASVNNLQNAWFLYRAELDKQFGITQKVMSGMDMLTGVLDTLRMSHDDQRMALQDLGDLWNTIVEEMAGGAVSLELDFSALFKTINSDAISAFRTINEQVGVTNDQLYNFVDNILTIFYNLNDAMPIILGGIPDAVASYTIDAMNAMLIKIADGINKLRDKIKPLRDWFAPWTMSPEEQLRGDQFGKEKFKFDEIPNNYKKAWEETSAEIARIMSRDQNILAETYRRMQEIYNKFQANRLERIYNDPSRAQDIYTGPMKSFELAPGSAELELTEKQIKALERKKEAMDRINDALERTYEEIAALGMSDDVLNSLTDKFKRDKEVEKYAKALRKAGVETQFITQKTEELSRALEQRDILMKQREALVEFRDSLTSAFDALSMSIIDVFTDGENAAENFKQTVKRVINDIIDTWIKLAVLNPIKNWLFGTDEPTLSKGLLGSVFGAFSGGGAKKASSSWGNGAISEILGAVTKVPNIANSDSLLGNHGLPGQSVASLGSYTEDLVSNIHVLSKNIGASAREIATVFSFESGFNPKIWGGKGGNHFGLIQAGAAERAAYGINPGGSLASQFKGIEAFFKDRGFKPGMSGMDLYSTVNAGRPGLYNRSDTANGGTWGTVADKWNHQMDAHFKKADELLGKFNGNLKNVGNTMSKIPAATQNAAQGLGNLGEGFQKFGANLQNFLSSASGGGSSWFQGLSGLFGGVGGALNSMWSISPLATMDILSGSWGLFHGGAIAGQTSSGRSKKISPAMFMNAPRFHDGLAQDEFGAILQKGEEVIPKGGRRGSGIIVNFIVENNAGVNVTQHQRANPEGGMDLIAIIDQATADVMTRPGTMTDKAIKTRFNQRVAIKRRY